MSAKGITYQAKDVLFKTLSEMFKDKALIMYGLDYPKIVEMLPNEFPEVKADERRADSVFLLEDGSILLLEYESNNRITENMYKYIDYVLRISRKYYEENRKIKKVNVAVIYASNIEKAESRFSMGSVGINVKSVFMKNYDGDIIYKDVESKIKENKILEDMDLMNLILLPLMRSKKDKHELIKDTIELAKEVNDERNQYFIIAGVLTSTDKFIDEEYANVVRSWLKMTKVEKIFEKEKEEAMNQAEKGKAIEIAKNMLLDNEDIEKIVRYTKLSIEEINKLKEVIGL
ncbi:transcriptional regulator [Clostridium sp. AWRP]|uniref:transcriptional regulator n=1 Tax=Clostridium sp. AWRP TaxID=2212991 RepID=UPI000FD82A6C|nr:transcriptional regulator [Clostridium sp. AWRP]AZV57875.1 transcriptional regulator [Clostridium sp. AWRP]